MRTFYDERGYYIAEKELKESYNALIENDEFTGTFEQYISECTGKNGTLEIAEYLENEDNNSFDSAYILKEV